jgi:hypothetical protein
MKGRLLNQGANPNRFKPIQAKGLGFTTVYFFESSLFNELREKK